MKRVGIAGIQRQKLLNVNITNMYYDLNINFKEILLKCLSHSF